MNLLAKTTPWVVASLLAAATAFGDDKCRPQKSFEQGRQLAQTQMMPGYDAPARIDVRGAWDFYASASFIYWQMLQDNMSYAFVDSLSDTNRISNSQLQGNFAELNFKYQPGFKVGLGMNFDQDNWDSYAEYTRLYSSDRSSTTGALDPSGAQAPILPTVGHPVTIGSNAFNAASAHWNCSLNFADIDLGRVYYVGTNLTFRPAFGARGAWIQQGYFVDYTNDVFSSSGEALGPTSVTMRTHSWAVGPRAGLNTNWMVGQGIRFYGNANADMLYTKYKVQSKTHQQLTSTGATQFFIAKDRVMALRTHLDLELGLGWGSYFDNNNWHIDLSASYGFQVFFNQNMFPRYLDDLMAGSFMDASGNLYAQGLTANVRLDF
ncbi:MAG: hypothetical protein HY861_03015 [Chlamydiia bacterium]|nr:hypothetical protein [Chlamydiia bacterium]